MTTRDGAFSGQRSHSRTPVVSFVWYQFVGRTGYPELYGNANAPQDNQDSQDGQIAHTSDISDGGLGFVSVHRVTVGSHVFLEIASSQGNVSAVGRVKHCEQNKAGLFNIGIRFEIVPPNHRPILKAITG